MADVKLLKEIIEDIDDRGYLRRRESTQLEFKEKFGLKSSAKYLKSIAAFANPKGGIIIYGVKDSPRIPVGINRDKFDAIKQEKISTFLSEYFSPEIIWDIGLFEALGKWFGYIEIQESEYKPVICKKDAQGVLRNGDIFYRYRAQSKLIQFPELKQIQDEIKEKERQLWMKHIERISRIGPQHVAFLDLFDGSIEVGTGKSQLILDPELLADLKNKVKFIEEGNISEKEGAPTLKIVGEIHQTDSILAPKLDPNKDYPFLQKHLAQELGLRPFDVQVLIWKFNIKGNKKYHIEIETSETTRTNKYSRYALRYLKQKLAEQDDKHRFLKNLIKQYTNRNKNKTT